MHWRWRPLINESSR